MISTPSHPHPIFLRPSTSIPSPQPKSRALLLLEKYSVTNCFNSGFILLLYNKNQKVPEITIIAEYNNIATLRKLAVNRYFTLLEEGEIDDGAD